MFKPITEVHKARFNSDASCKFLTAYEDFATKQILEEETRQPSMTFAPSSIRCKRISWFRLRGVAPEQEVEVDRSFNFTAKIGTACHRIIQEQLAEQLGDDWLDVEEYLNSMERPYKYTCTKSGMETNVEIEEPAIKFSPDGLLRFKDKIYLLEIKTSEYGSFNELEAPKPHHIDQIKCYATLLNVKDVLVLYQDRQYGGMKCYELHISAGDMQMVWDMFKEVQDCVKNNIPPARLPKGDKWCSPSRCRYFNKCKEW